MKIKMIILLSLVLSVAIFTGCNKEAPVAQQEQSLINEDDALALYMLGNEGPIEAEMTSSFLFDGPGPFFLWVLDLTDEQKAQIREIGDKYRQAMFDLHRQGREGGDWQALREKHRELREQRMEEIKGILTEEQLAVLAEIEAQIEAGEFPAIVIEKRVAMLTEKLNLSDEQQQQVKDLMSEYGNQLLAIRKNAENPRDAREAGRELLKEYRDAFKSLLTEEQLALFEDMRAEFRSHHKHRKQPPHGGMRH